MKKLEYEVPDMELVKFETQDCITNSGNGPSDDTIEGDNIFNPKSPLSSLFD